MTRLTVWVLLLCLTSCLDGIDVEQDSFRRFPDEKINLIVFHAISPDDWLSVGMDSTDYADSLLLRYGENRSLSFRDPENPGNVYAYFEVPTISQRNSFGCTTLESTLVVLSEGDYDLYENEASPIWIERYFFTYLGEDCTLLPLDFE